MPLNMFSQRDCLTPMRYLKVYNVPQFVNQWKIPWTLTLSCTLFNNRYRYINISVEEHTLILECISLIQKHICQGVRRFMIRLLIYHSKMHIFWKYSEVYHDTKCQRLKLILSKSNIYVCIFHRLYVFMSKGALPSKLFSCVNILSKFQPLFYLVLYLMQLQNDLSLRSNLLIRFALVNPHSQILRNK